MAPTRRYLRITKYTVLECRIYMEDPMLTDSWLLRKNNPALPRIIAAVRESVLPKLREENERMRTKQKGKKKGAIKDLIAQDDFQVCIFLKDQSSRHSLLVKNKDFKDKPKLTSNSNKLTGWLAGGDSDRPIDVDAPVPPLLVEDDEDVDLSAIPQAPTNLDDEDAVTIPSDDDNRDDGLFVKNKQSNGGGEDKKKLGIKTMYDGFAIYGKILCLIVKRTNVPSTVRAGASGQAMMENWVSTQVAQEMGYEEQG